MEGHQPAVFYQSGCVWQVLLFKFLLRYIFIVSYNTMNINRNFKYWIFVLSVVISVYQENHRALLEGFAWTGAVRVFSGLLINKTDPAELLRETSVTFSLSVWMVSLLNSGLHLIGAAIACSWSTSNQCFWFVRCCSVSYMLWPRLQCTAITGMVRYVEAHLICYTVCILYVVCYLQFFYFAEKSVMDFVSSKCVNFRRCVLLWGCLFLHLLSTKASIVLILGWCWFTVGPTYKPSKNQFSFAQATIYKWSLVPDQQSVGAALGQFLWFQIRCRAF